MTRTYASSAGGGGGGVSDHGALTGLSDDDHTQYTLLSKSFFIGDPTATEDLSLFFTDEAITITKMVAVLTGSATPSVTWTVRHDADRSAAGTEVVTSGTTTTSITTGSVVTSFNDATVDADDFIWLETTAQSGTVTSLMVTIFYTRLP